MPSSINIPAIMIANIMGLTILFVVAVGNYWRVKENSKENWCIVALFIASAISCIADPICFIADGRPGAINYFLVLICNTWLYVGNIIVSIAWISLVINHMGARISKLHQSVLAAISIVLSLVLVVNFFVPIVFSVDSNNVYSRTDVYYVYTVVFAVFMADGLVLYFNERNRSGKLKFFPVWAFIIPATIGVIIQSVFYGVSTIIPFITVSISCVMTSFQNEFLFKDKLTGLYNRFYLNTIEKRLKNSNREYTAIMADINEFKKINDTYGHRVGDEALIHTAELLKSVVGATGEVVRYAGDEFIIISNIHDEAAAQALVNEIYKAMAGFSSDSGVPYELSVSLGYCRFNAKETHFDEFMDKIDKLMYENKKEYYKTHIRFDRRSE